MVSQTNEQALEATIERALAGIGCEELEVQAGNGDSAALQQADQYHTNIGQGCQLGWSSDNVRSYYRD